MNTVAASMANDLVVEQGHPFLVVQEDFRLEGAVLVSGNLDDGALIFQRYRLFGVSLSAVPAVVCGAGVFLVAQMLRHREAKVPGVRCPLEDSA
jgi:hypothetical protein